MWLRLDRGLPLRAVVPCGDKSSPWSLPPGVQSESARSKMLSGIGGCVLGVIFLGLGLFIRHRSQKGDRLWGTGVVGCAEEEVGLQWEDPGLLV